MKPNILPLALLLCALPIAPLSAREKMYNQGAEHLFISPMGEPFRGDGRAGLIATWFTAADTNHDGKLTQVEFRADAERFFNVLDLNHDGEIDPAENENYEVKIAPEIATGSGFARQSTYDAAQGAARFGMLDIPQPVMSADTDFNRGVSRAEWQRAAIQRFKALDYKHQGYLTIADLPGRPPKILKKDGDLEPAQPDQ